MREPMITNTNLDRVFPGFDTPAHWSILRDRAAKARQLAEGVALKYEDTVSYQSIDQLIREEIIAALRAGEESETLYWKLRYFAEAYRHAPVMQTDKGKVLYVAVENRTGTVSLVIGDASEMLTIGRKGPRTHYVLPVNERYEFVPYELIGAVARRHADLNMLIDELAPEASVKDAKVPVLVFSISDLGCEASEATLSCDLSIADPKKRMTESRPPGDDPSLAAAYSKLNALESALSKIVVVVPPNADDVHYRTA